MRVTAMLALVTASVISCGATTSTPAGPVIVVLQSPDLPDGLDLVSPAVLGFNLALAESGVTIRVRAADPGGVAAMEAAADPSVIAVVVAPFTLPGRTAADALERAGVPVLSLSAMDDHPAALGARWWRMVPDALEMALWTFDAALTASSEGCVLVEAGAWSERMAAWVEEVARGKGWVPAPGVDGCAAVLWSGSAAGAAAVRADLVGPLIVTDQARTEGFIASTDMSTTTTSGACGCRDLSTSARPADQAFVHAYQEATGLDPGPYAAEGFDAGELILSLLAGVDEPSREALAAAIEGSGGFRGVARRYDWDARGDLAPPVVRIYRAEGVRWLPVGRAG
jgi:hypothetical protein